MTPTDALNFELRQRVTAAMLHVGLLVRTHSLEDFSLRLDALEHEFSLISVLMQTLVARDGRNDERLEADGLTVLTGVEQTRRPAAHWSLGLTEPDGAVAQMERAH